MRIIVLFMMCFVMNLSVAQNFRIKIVKEKLEGVSKTKREYQVIDNGINAQRGYFVKHGYYKEIFKKDVVVSGSYKHDQKEGVWVYKDPEENYLQKGSFHQGKKVGVWSAYKKDALSSKMYYNNQGRLDSLFRYNSNDELVGYYHYDPIYKINYSKEEFGLGIKKEIIRMDSIKLKIKLFYPNDQLLEERKFEGKRLAYVSDIYDMDGNILLASKMNGGNGLLQTIYLDNILEGVCVVKDVVSYKNGIPNGEHVTHSIEGKLLFEGVNKEGFPFGKWKNWNVKKKKYTFLKHTLNSKKKTKDRKVFVTDSKRFSHSLHKKIKTSPIVLMNNRNETDDSLHKQDLSEVINESLLEYMNLEKLERYFPETEDGVHRIRVTFTINTLGEVSDIKIKSASKSILVKLQVEKALSKLPVLIPASLPNSGKFVNLVFRLPIVFKSKKN